jgi:hypothetical protein
MTTQYERELYSLEQELAEAETDEERKAIRAAIRDIGREESEREEWLEEGHERGWL